MLNITRALTSAVRFGDASRFLLVLLLLQLLLGSQASEASHRLLEREGRVEDIQSEAGDDHHDALEADEQPLVPDQVSGPALAELRNSVHASPEDADGGERQCGHEALEPDAPARLDEDGVLVEGVLAHGLVALVCAEREIHAENHEDEEREDLER